MRKDTIRAYKIFKVCQLLLLIIIIAIFCIYLKTDYMISSIIFTNTKLLTFFAFLCVFMLFSLFAILIDLKNLAFEYDMNRIAYHDSLTGIPNRISCDIIFEKYENLEDISGFSAALISITNLPIINETLGRERGDHLIQDFASIFENVASEYGFFGRNGGNEFLIVIENCNEAKMNEFLNKLSAAVSNYNDTIEHMPLTYKSSAVYSDNLEKPVFNDLISQLYKTKQ